EHRGRLRMAVVRKAVRLLAVSVAVSSLFSVSPGSAIGASIGPEQHFVGLINGRHRSAEIYLDCPGPPQVGRTGPLAGKQTVSVRRVRIRGGDTGSIGHAIWAGSTMISRPSFDSRDTGHPN